MYADRRINNSLGNVSKNEIPLVEPFEIMNFLEEMLKFAISEIEIDDDEDLITQKMLQISIASNSSLVFVAQNKTKGVQSKEDIGVSPKSNPTKVFFVIEAKRLPSSSKKEYLIGVTGGIERFKREKHAKNFDYAGMIGYVQKKTFDDWENEINAWINEEIKSPSSCDLRWSEDDKLIKESSSQETARYSSKHLCISKKEIKLFHLWIDLV
ncbi:hypothetical protein [Aliarcobacter butzleri]|uniref:hypothetical protein n=1 Tax=Aliarcobacter butzleri TaxID=28197 RepID=UPI0021B3B8FA|nr:hypothetical protein [Aliarcobacter butzleri]MCT7554949.1 hypothetical protein [Aliarcobacter butzleri]